MALTSVEDRYAAAGVSRFAAWVHEGDAPMREDLEARASTLDTSTLAMSASLGDLPPRRRADQRRGPGLRPRRLRHRHRLDRGAVPAPGARHRPDRAQLHHARERGCTRATLQSSLMAEGVYAEAGFRSLGRILEYVPPEG